MATMSYQILSLAFAGAPFAKVALTALATLGMAAFGMAAEIPDDPTEAEEEAEDVPADGDAGEGGAADEKVAEEKVAADEKAAEEKVAADEKAADEKKAAEEKAADEKAAAEKKAAEEKAADEKAAAEKKAAEEKVAADEKAADPAAGAVAADAAAPVAPVAADAAGEAGDPAAAPPADGEPSTLRKILTAGGIALGSLVAIAAILFIVMGLRRNSATDASATGSASAPAPAPSSSAPVAKFVSLCPAGYTAYAADDDNTCALLGYPASEVRDEIVTSPSPSHLVVCRNPPQWDKTNKMTDISGSECEICFPAAVKPGEKIPMDIAARLLWGQRPSKMRQADWATLPCGQPRYPKCGLDVVDCTPVANPDGTMDMTGCYILAKYVSPKSK